MGKFFIISIILELSTILHAKGRFPLYSTATVENELARRSENNQNEIGNKSQEVLRYLMAGKILEAQAVLNIMKAKTLSHSKITQELEGLLDQMQGLPENALRSYLAQSEPTLRSCFQSLLLLWEKEMWTEANLHMQKCGPTLAKDADKNYFTLRLWQQFKQSELTEKNIVPAPLFYYYIPDFSLVTQWLRIIILQKKEHIAKNHLTKIPPDMLKQSDVRTLVAIALFNVGDVQTSLEQTQLIDPGLRSKIEYKLLVGAQAFYQNDLQLSFATSKEIYQLYPELIENSARYVLLSWMLGKPELIKEIPKNIAIGISHLFPEIGLLAMTGLASEEQWNLLSKWRTDYFNKSSNLKGILGAINQYTALKQNRMGEFNQQAQINCSNKLAMGCWPLLSTQDFSESLTTRTFSYESVEEYFSEVLSDYK